MRGILSWVGGIDSCFKTYKCLCLLHWGDISTFPYVRRLSLRTTGTATTLSCCSRTPGWTRRPSCAPPTWCWPPGPTSPRRPAPTRPITGRPITQPRDRRRYTLQRHKKENLRQIFLEKELLGLSPNFHIHVFVSNLYIPTIGHSQTHDCGNWDFIHCKKS